MSTTCCGAWRRMSRLLAVLGVVLAARRLRRRRRRLAARLCRGRVCPARGAGRRLAARACRCSAATGSRPGALLFALEDGRQRAAVGEAEAQLARAQLAARRPEAGQAAGGDRADRGQPRRGQGGAGLCRAGPGPAGQARPARFRRRGAPRSGALGGRGGAGARRRHGGRSRHRPAAGARRPDRRCRGRGRDARGRPGPGALGAGAAHGARADGRHGRGPRARQPANGSMPAASWSACCRPARSRCASSCPSRSSVGVRVGQAVDLRCDGCAAGHDRHRPLHRARGRVHAAGDLQRRQPRQAGVHGRGLARGRASRSIPASRWTCGLR